MGMEIFWNRKIVLFVFHLTVINIGTIKSDLVFKSGRGYSLIRVQFDVQKREIPSPTLPGATNFVIALFLKLWLFNSHYTKALFSLENSAPQVSFRVKGLGAVHWPSLTVNESILLFCLLPFPFLSSLFHFLLLLVITSMYML